MKKVEASIQRELIKWLRKKYKFIEPRYNKIENCNENDRMMGIAVAGTPDLTLFVHKEHYTYIFELELKTKEGKLNKSQKEWWEKFKPTKNRRGVVAYGLFDAQEKVKEWLEKNSLY